MTVKHSLFSKLFRAKTVSKMFFWKTFIENIICNNLSWFRKFQMEIDHKWNSGLNTRIIVDVIAVTTAVQGRISKLKFTTWSFPQDFVLCLMSLSCSILEILSPNEIGRSGFFTIHSYFIGTGHCHFIWTVDFSMRSFWFGQIVCLSDHLIQQCMVKQFRNIQIVWRI